MPATTTARARLAGTFAVGTPTFVALLLSILMALGELVPGVGAVLLGPAGAFIAMPFAAMLQVLFEEVILPRRRAQLAPAEEAEQTVG